MMEMRSDIRKTDLMMVIVMRKMGASGERYGTGDLFSQ